MPGLPFFDGTAPQPTRVPAVEISFDGGGESGGFGGIVDAAADLLGGGGGAASWADHLVELKLQLGFAPRVDELDLVIGQSEGAPQASLGDNGSIALGPSGATESLFSGRVIAVENRGDGLRRYRLANGGHQLAGSRISQSVTDMSAADAIGYAVGELGLQVEADISGSDGPLVQYVFDDSRSLWDHIAELAALRGINAWFSSDNRLQLADALEQGDPAATFTYGSDLLEHRLWQRTPHSGAVTVIGGARADDGFTLRKQSAPNLATSGDGPPQRFYRQGALRSQDDLTTHAGAAALGGQRQTQIGELLVAGNAAARPGRVVELAGLRGAGDGLYIVTAAHHRFDRRDGWRTRLSVASTEAAAGSGLTALVGGLI